ncbi:helix-turn-helix domain-containing protein [Adhaeretor mobilis]|uniref:Helix-turn-helix domain-containing protein n=1 Tax=Adhaeretor mobilis TaxID=1930276 RepID=A0A517MXQ7_9BACT|nr:helix-turn-helix domain-containing protein [Adhaeretor mobilis]QDS99664.1 hypothetical protein HG15A2_29910 [Adhaeretor mobilis]
MDFLKFEDALEKLGITSERLNQLRESGELRAYRDGGSWKFRGDEIEKMSADGVPEPAPPSDIGLVPDDELEASAPIEVEDDDDLKLADDDDLALDTEELSLESSGLDLDMGSKEASKPVPSKAEESSLELGELEDIELAEASDVIIDDPDATDPADSILLSEEELGESVAAPASTIIGKEELGLEDADLELASEDDTDGSELELASDPGASDVLSSGIAGSGVLDELTDESGGMSAFEDLDELEIDLEAESSRILSPEEAAKVKAAAAAAPKPSAELDSDLTLDDDGTDPVPSDLEIAADDGTDPVPSDLELEIADDGTDPNVEEELELELAPSDSAVGDSDIDLGGSGSDFVLADGSGSDVTLNSGDSGINLVSPSDSGLALDDIPLEMGGSAILSSLSLGGTDSDPDFSLVADDIPAAGGSQKAAVQEDEDFQLTPLSEGAIDEDPDSSSQVIALDAVEDDFGASDAGILGGDAFAEDTGDAVLLTEDDAVPMDELGAGVYAGGGAAAVRSDSDYSIWNILSLAGCAMLSMLSIMLLTDMIRNIWSWDETTSLNSSLLDGLLGMFGLK